MQHRITLRGCSFIDDPEAALAKLSEIAMADRAGRPYYVDFFDDNFVDLAPILIFSLLRKAMRPNTLRGGRITKRLTGLFQALNITNFAGIQVRGESQGEFWPIPVQSANIAASDGAHRIARAQNYSASLMTREINRWLGRAGYSLTDHAKGRILTFLGEILDNSRHAHTNREGAEWSIAGVMSPDPAAGKFYCHLAIVTLGRPFSESLKHADNEIIRDAVADYARRHAQTGAPETLEPLITVMALQDGITSDGKRGGCGMSQLVEVINRLGCDSVPPDLVIVSGRSCVRVSPPYGTMHRRTVDGAEPSMVQFFNPEQSAKCPPAPTHVFSLSRAFPGTVITTRFVLDSDDLERKSSQ